MLPLQLTERAEQNSVSNFILTGQSLRERLEERAKISRLRRGGGTENGVKLTVGERAGARCPKNVSP